MSSPGSSIYHGEAMTDGHQEEVAAAADSSNRNVVSTVSGVIAGTTQPRGSESNTNVTTQSTSTGFKDPQTSTSVTVTRAPETLTVDSIEITYDIANKDYDYYKQKTENKHSKVLKMATLFISVLLFGLQAPYPSPFSCFVPAATDVELHDRRADECIVNYVQLIAVLIVTATELIVLLPLFMKPLLVTSIRMIQICCLMLVKLQIHQYLQHTSGLAVSTGYVGYILLCGSVVACFTTEIPGKEKRVRKFHATVISALTAVAFVVEIGLNTYQTILLSDMLVGFISVVVLYLMIGGVFYVFKIWKQYGQAFKLLVFTYIVGHIALMYLTLPALHFEQLIIQIGLYASAVIVYSIIFATHQYFRFH